jgi:phosphoribosylglycinamide formyltransferase-1
VKHKIKVAIFISGKGTNALNLMHYFSNNSTQEIALVFSTRQNEEIALACETFGVNFFEHKTEMGNWSDLALSVCKSHDIDFIVLAGFLKKVTPQIIQAFPDRIINLHPSLLPKFGGKGMYGKYVHEAVIASKEKKSGITIHFVNENFDEGKIIAQFETTVTENDDASSLAKKINALEMENLPIVLSNLISKNSAY